jgi:hypothetical protein
MRDIPKAAIGNWFLELDILQILVAKNFGPRLREGAGPLRGPTGAVVSAHYRDLREPVIESDTDQNEMKCDFDCVDHDGFPCRINAARLPPPGMQPGCAY